MELNFTQGELLEVTEENKKIKYISEKIVFHSPAEHVVEFDGQVIQYPLEMQIYHKYDSKQVEEVKTNSTVAVVSIFFADVANAYQGDLFLDSLGINKYLVGYNTTMSLMKEKQKLSNIVRKKLQPIAKNIGFDVFAFNNLRNVLNVDYQMVKYLGSLTQPPCSENVAWFIFQLPRSMSVFQKEFFKQQMQQVHDDANLVANEHISKEFQFGNNREVQI